MEAQSAVTVALKDTCEQFRWKYRDLRYGFLCHDCPGYSEHLSLILEAKPIPSSLPEYTNCEDKLTEAQNIWFCPLQVSGLQLLRAVVSLLP